jgi:hypothetical protein
MDFLDTFAAGRDPVIFAEQILGLRLNPAQQRWLRTACATKDGWQWKYRRSIHVAANQIGKTLGLAVSVLWAANYKIGVENNDWDSWLNTQYNWFHLAPTYVQSMLLFNDIKALAEGKHPAQMDRDTGQFRKALWQPGLAVDRKIDGTYYAIELWNGSRIHFRTSDNKAKSLQGVRAHGISFDEAAFEDHLLAVIDQAVKLRLISTGGPLWMVSTPNGLNDFYQVAQEVLNNAIETADRQWEAPARRLSLVWSHMSDNIGFGFSKEDADFMEMDVDPATKEQQLRGAFLEPQDAFFVPTSDIEKAFVPIPQEQEPQNGHQYVIFWDVSIASDPTVCVILDVTNEVVKGVYYRRWEKPMPFRELVSEMTRLHWMYNTPVQYSGGFPPKALTGFDASSMGGVAVRQELQGLNPMRALTMSGSSKMKTEMLINLRTMLSTRKLLLPDKWTQMKREILSYRRDDDHLQQDSVMALTGGAKLAQAGYTGQRRVKFDAGARTRSWSVR